MKKFFFFFFNYFYYNYYVINKHKLLFMKRKNRVDINMIKLGQRNNLKLIKNI